ncbi:MAG: protease complex subunit PrcB family protein [Bacillota bacterium]
MARSHVLPAILLAAALALTACSRPAATTPDAQPPAASPAAKTVSFEPVSPENLSGNVRMWADGYSHSRGAFGATWDGKTYLLFAWGERPSGGYAVQVDRVEDDGRRNYTVRVSLQEPAPGQPVIMMMTYPFALVALPKLDGPVTVAYSGPDDLGQLHPESPQVRLEKPWNGAAAVSPLEIRGRTQGLEGELEVSLEDGHDIRGTRKVQVSADGSLELSLPFDRPTNPFGMLIFTAVKDGKREQVLMVPVKFQQD